jgi:hypothetical protein
MVRKMLCLKRPRARVRPLIPAPMMAIETLAVMEMASLSSYFVNEKLKI